MSDNIAELEKSIGVDFKNKDLLLQSLCHRSYLNENPDFHLGQNERLEFLGDAVLELAVTEYLYVNYPDKTEGELTSWRASLVNTKVIGKVAEEMGLYDYILLSKGESNDRGKSHICILADTFEALIGAIYLDKGYKKAREFVEENVVKELPRIIELGLHKDPKSVLQEKTQDKMSITPDYRVVHEAGPDHRKYFVVAVHAEEEMLGKGDGYSKKEAEEKAAKAALVKKGWLKNKS